MKKFICNILILTIFCFYILPFQSFASFSRPKAVYPTFSYYENLDQSNSLNSSLEVDSSIDSLEQANLSNCEDLFSICDSPILFSIGCSSKVASIRNEFEFKIFSDNVNSGFNYEGKMVILENDLNLENFKWDSIGNKNNPFKGFFEGNHYKITLGNSNKPLFAYAENAGIYDIKLIGKNPILISNSYNVITENCSHILTT